MRYGLATGGRDGRRWLAGLALLFVLAAASAAERTTTLNLKNADITAVIESVAEITGRNFIVDPRVKGKVNVVSHQPMDADEVYQVFLSILNVHGFAAVPAGDATKIIPEVHAKQSGGPDGGRGARGDQYLTRVLAVEHVAAAQLVPVLRPLVPQHAHLAAYPPSNMLIVSASAANVGRLVQMVGRIDVPAEAGLEVIPLEHASAGEVVQILEKVQAAEDKGRAPGTAVRLAADLRTNSILLSGGKPDRLRLRTVISHLDTPLEETGNTRVLYLRYADAKALVPVLTGVGENLGEEKGGKQEQNRERVSIQADESTNALVINAPPDLIKDLEAVVRKLDVRRAQVLVEAVIAEVSSDQADELGIQWVYDGSNGNSPVGVVNFFSNTGSGITGLLADPPVLGDGISLLVGDTDSGKDGTRGGAFLRALAGDANTNVLSTPSLVTMDNEEAEIVVGKNVPFITGSYTSTGDGSTPDNPFQTIERQDVGLTLRVKPQINEGDAVKLAVEQEVSSLDSTSTGTADVVTTKRSLKTTVMVDNGQVVVLGGLIDDTLNESVQKVPGLGEIPVLKHLFTYRKSTKVKRNLMVFLRPVILRDAAQNTAVAGEKYNYMRARQLAVRAGDETLTAQDDAPVMPELDQWLQLPEPFAGLGEGQRAPAGEGDGDGDG